MDELAAFGSRMKSVETKKKKFWSAGKNKARIINKGTTLKDVMKRKGY
jgi:hypothetical protein